MKQECTIKEMSRETLREFGLDTYNIQGFETFVTHEFPDGWVEITIFDYPFNDFLTNNYVFDLPRRYVNIKL